MEDFLRRHKLIDRFTIELPVHKSYFVGRLQSTVDPGDTGMFSGAFEAWESDQPPSVFPTIFASCGRATNSSRICTHAGIPEPKWIGVFMAQSSDWLARRKT